MARAEFRMRHFQTLLIRIGIKQFNLILFQQFAKFEADGPYALNSHFQTLQRIAAIAMKHSRTQAAIRPALTAWCAGRRKAG